MKYLPNKRLKYENIFLSIIIMLLFHTNILANDCEYIPTIYKQLCELNKYWSNNECEHPILQKKIKILAHEELIQLHLLLVEKALRQRAVTKLSPTQQTKRLEGLSILKEYWKKGRFPQNTGHQSLRPYFVDDWNTACAVGHILRESGENSLVNRIETENNFAYIEQMKYPELSEWATKMGFTIDELKWIQPGYQPIVTGTVETQQPTCSSENGRIDLTVVPFNSAESSEDTLEVSVNWFEVSSPALKSLGSSLSLENVSSGVYQTALNTNTWSPCAAVTIVRLESEDAPKIEENIQHPICANSEEGSIELSISGGQAPYTVAWFDERNKYLGSGMRIDGLRGRSQDLISMCPTSNYNYWASVTDANACQAFKTFLLRDSNYGFFLFSSSDSRAASCGQADGRIVFTTIGESNAYTYQWSHDDALNESSADNLTTGLYTVTVSDELGCSVVENFNVNEKEAAKIYVQTKSNVHCEELGFIEVYPSDTTQTYTYTWSHQLDLNSPIAADLEEGTYTVSVTGTNNCTATKTFEVSSYNDLLLPHPSIQNITDDNSDGRIFIEIYGEETHTYSWSHDPTLTEATAKGLEAGTYSVTVTDNFGCTAVQQVAIINTSNEEEAVSNNNIMVSSLPAIQVELYPNPAHYYLQGHIFSKKNQTNSTVLIFDALGREMHRQKMNNKSFKLDISAYPQGMYFIQVAQKQISHSQKFLKQ